MPAEEFRLRVTTALEALDIGVEMYHHEDAPSQQEIDVTTSDAMAMADSLITLRLVSKEVAQELGLHASFMPKPAAGIQGSGMHTHLRLLEEGGRSALHDPAAEAGLSKVARAFVLRTQPGPRIATALSERHARRHREEQLEPDSGGLRRVAAAARC